MIIYLLCNYDKRKRDCVLILKDVNDLFSSFYGKQESEHLSTNCKIEFVTNVVTRELTAF